MSEAATETITSASMRIQRVIEISCEPKEKRSCASKQKTRVGFRVNGADQSVKKKKRLQESSMQVNLKILPDWEIHEDTQRTK